VAVATYLLPTAELPGALQLCTTYFIAVPLGQT
jgi:hypothetical protein